MTRPLPGEAKRDIEEASKFQITDKGRDYREVNRENDHKDGMERLRPEDYGRGSRGGREETSRRSDREESSRRR